MLKRGINGTYIHVSKKHLQKYLWEFEHRHNLRHAPHLMFDLFLLVFFFWFSKNQFCDSTQKALETLFGFRVKIFGKLAFANHKGSI
jgi:hypothetical protein